MCPSALCYDKDRNRIGRDLYETAHPFFIMLGLIVSGLIIVFLSRLIYAHLYPLLPALDLVQIALLGMVVAAVGLAWGHCTIRCPHCGGSMSQHNLFQPQCPRCGRDVDWR